MMRCRRLGPLRWAAAVVFAVAAAAPALAQGQGANLDDPCRAATAPVRYGKILKVPRRVRGEIAAYRRAWAAACRKGGGSSLAALLARAERIKAGMTKAIRRARPQAKRAERLHEQLSKVYPTFVPAFAGSIMEFEFFDPMLDAFKAKLRLGNAEDRAFFRDYDRLFGGDFKAQPWIERTWDYGGCIRLGRWSPNGPARPGYDFLGALHAIGRLRAQVRAKWYRAKLARLDADILRTLRNLPQKREPGKPAVIDACGTKAEALAAMRRIAGGLRTGHGARRRARAALRKTLADIEAGRVRVCEKASCPNG
jgi:hypothetical protein